MTLKWPAGWPRTPANERISATFRVSYDKAYRELRDELRRLSDDDLWVISSNLPIKNDGTPYAEAFQQKFKDPGIAVYFNLNGKQMVMARDAYILPGDNVRSLGLAIEALRAVERHGGSYMMARAFDGFAALPPPKNWWDILRISRGATVDEISRAYRELAAKCHPDIPGGSDAMMAELNAARDQAIAELRS